MVKNTRRLGRLLVVRAAAAAVLLACAQGASAQAWDETIDGGGDAGPLPVGQVTMGTGPLNFITGDLEQGEESADLYCISIPDIAAFTASYFNAADGESGQLWLFDAAGNGVAHASDNTSPYAVGITPGLVTTTGNHFIAITRLGVQPVDGTGAPIFPTIASGQTGPNPGVGPVAGWQGPALHGPGPYRIIFEGASYHTEDDTGGGDGSQPDGGPWWTYETADHLSYGNLFNLELTQDATGEDCLRLTDDPKAWPFLAVANSQRGTLSRIAVQDIPAYGISEGDVIGEYLTAPFGMAANPSRTTVDGYGNVWVGNRNEWGSVAGEQKGSMTRVGLVIGGTRTDATGAPTVGGQYLQGPFEYCGCEDRDGDGLIKTSVGYPRTTGLPNADYVATQLPWPNTASADSFGGVSTAEDECITAYYRTEGTGVRHVSIDRNNDVWVSGTGNREFELVDGSLATQVTAFQAMCGGYGGVVDPDGIVWSAQWGTTGLLRYDPVSTAQQCLPIPNYGMGIDAECTTSMTEFAVWTSVANDPNARRISPAGVLQGAFPHGSAATPRGVVVKNGQVWVAHSGSNTVGHIDTFGNPVGNVTMFEAGNGVAGSGPHGVAADSNGKIWAVNNFSSNAMRIDPTLGVAGQVDLAVDLGSGAGPYNYSDMTGDLYLSIAPQGSWTFVHDGGMPGCEWGNITWTEQIIGNAGVSVRVRASDSPIPSGPWTDISNGVDFAATGQYLQVQVTLTREIVDCMPDGEVLLCDLMICKKADCFVEIDTVECDLGNPGTVNITGTITNNSGADATRIVFTPIPTGSGVTFSPNSIPVNIPNGSSGTFTTQLSGYTEGEEVCFQVTLLDPTFEICCTTEVCVTPDCDCLQVRQSTVEIACDPFTGDYTVTFEIDNLTGATIYHSYLFPPPGVTITPNYFAFPAGVPDQTSTGPITVVLSGAKAGEFCFDVTLHDEALFECCGREVCIDLPECITDPGGGTGTDGTGAAALPGPPWVHLNAGLTAGLDVGAGSDGIAEGVMTIINNSDEPRSFAWVINAGTNLGCDIAISPDAVQPSSGVTDMLDPGKCVDIPLMIDTRSVPLDMIGCIRGVIVDQANGFATSALGQVIAPQVLDDAEPAVVLTAVPAVEGVSPGAIVGIAVGSAVNLAFDVASDTATEIDVVVLSSNPFLSLAGAAPGMPYTETVAVQPGEPTRVSVPASLISAPGAWILDVSLNARPVGPYRPTRPQHLASLGVRDSAMERCVGDFNSDGVVDLSDINDFINAFVNNLPMGDIDGNGVFDLTDVNQFVLRFLAGCGV